MEITVYYLGVDIEDALHLAESIIVAAATSATAARPGQQVDKIGIM